jgi:hypothetical protein
LKQRFFPEFRGLCERPSLFPGMSIFEIGNVAGAALFREHAL